ncbi:MAG TPA: hypothetical protein VD840_02670, partial [Sinorhizobium sp.]|nr:hypothetical protein [Sinorhizobium sp.]
STMPDLTYRDAINLALAEEMRRDPTVLLMSEDAATLAPANQGGAGAGSGQPYCIVRRNSRRHRVVKRTQECNDTIVSMISLVVIRSE